MCGGPRRGARAGNASGPHGRRSGGRGRLPGGVLVALAALPFGLLAGPLRAQEVSSPASVAERTDYTATSTTADVAAFLDSLQATGAPLRVGVMGRSALGKPILLVVVSEPTVTSPAEAAASGKLVVYLQANIHGGEVEGKEAVQQLLRELAGPRRALLEHLVVLVAPVYNPDGNDALGPESLHRPEQKGPDSVGLRPDGLNLDLNRDYLKAEAPETRASLARVYDRWDPALMVDLHTTDGTHHGYLLTYSPPLQPDAPPGPLAFVRDSLLPSVRAAMQRDHDEPIFVYGNVRDPLHPEAWTTYAPLGWYGTNYVGLRGRMAILSEAYSHADFRTRVRVSHDFLVEILRYAVHHAGQIRRLEREADRATTLEGAGVRPRPELGVRFEAVSRGQEPVRLEVMRPTGDSARGRPALEPTGTFRTVRLPILDRFRATRTRRLPAGYFLPASEGATARLLRLHGLSVSELRAPWTDTVEVFVPDSLRWGERRFQGHALLDVEGRYERRARTLPAGTYYVSTAQPLGRLAFVLLEPEGYGLYRWNAFDRLLGTEEGALSGLVYGSGGVAELPVVRALREPRVARRSLR